MGLLNEHQKIRFVRRLRARQRQYRELLEMLPYGVVVYAKGVIRYANSTAARMIGAASQTQLIGRRYADLVLSAAPSPQLPTEQQTLRRLDGKIVEVEATTHTFTRRKHRITQVVWRTVEELAPAVTAAERLRMVADAATAIIMLDPVGDITQWCQAAERMMGYSPPQIIGRSLSVLTAPEETEHHNLDEILRASVKNGR
jgi:PAS domain S-box-containing protein